MVVIILCTGKGTRAREVTGNIPKSLYPLPRWTGIGHLLNFVEAINHKEVRIVVNPADMEHFSQYCGWLKMTRFCVPVGGFIGNNDRCSLLLQNVNTP